MPISTCRIAGGCRVHRHAGRAGRSGFDGSDGSRASGHRDPRRTASVDRGSASNATEPRPGSRHGGGCAYIGTTTRSLCGVSEGTDNKGDAEVETGGSLCRNSRRPRRPSLTRSRGTCLRLRRGEGSSPTPNSGPSLISDPSFERARELRTAGWRWWRCGRRRWPRSTRWPSHRPHA